MRVLTDVKWLYKGTVQGKFCFERKGSYTDKDTLLVEGALKYVVGKDYVYFLSMAEIEGVQVPSIEYGFRTARRIACGELKPKRLIPIGLINDERED